MPKKKLVDIAEEANMSFDEAFGIAKEKLAQESMTGRGKATWIDEEGQGILAVALEVPEIVPKMYKARVVHEAPNPHYVYAVIRELGKKVPVVIGKHYMKKLVGKNIDVEAIQDNQGVSYRHLPQKRV
jgi:hypothetical protein